MRFVLATRNTHKVDEIRDILRDEKLELLSLLDFKFTFEVIENGNTFLSNALKKARAAFRSTGIPSLADDSGLEVDYLNGGPGIHSNRFAGENGNYAANNQKLLKLLDGLPEGKRTAKFRCVVACADGKKEKYTEGICKGIILSEYRGHNGFGYDPLFFIPEKGRTFAEMSQKEKNKISHRGIAFRKMAAILNAMN